MFMSVLQKCQEKSSSVPKSERELSKMQFGFREGLSTVDAFRTVVGKAENASKQKRRGDWYYAVVMIDVRIAFNNVNWEVIVAWRCIIYGFLTTYVIY